VKRLSLFGSIVRNEAGEASDIDLLIELDPDCVTYWKYLDLEAYLQSLFPRSVEIVTTDGVCPIFFPTLHGKWSGFE
jgi:hypothetical protein